MTKYFMEITELIHVKQLISVWYIMFHKFLLLLSLLLLTLNLVVSTRRELWNSMKIKILVDTEKFFLLAH